ncbi:MULTISPECIES: hypothetical protein [Chryseobacterium]|uniref:DUF4340 domain-containing protein n=1 Tax=Chryseobacterium geocarposphaerae TaxID=1416776 RepID=A0ABU1LED0_9FLAO|nr:MULTISPECIES: hypothetical protein [Chryseobacterium]MDR6404910.1 hypothetical protein [Chryseobacterium geocarposphaerae]MDR6697693.1 hypothetical protein [Chryseobacterium ginsenosidimutans]
MKRKLIVLAVFLIAATIYFLLFHKNKTLKYIPENADAVILIDVKNLKRQYIASFATHPSQWFRGKGKKGNTNFIQESGVEIPDFFQIFHIKNTSFLQWYCVFELTDKQKFSAYLKQQKFVRKGENIFQKDQLFLKIDGKKCIVGTSDLAFEKISHSMSSGKNVFNADSFIDNSLGSISFISGQRIRNFSIDLNSDEIEIKNTPKTENFAPIISDFQQKMLFLDAELDAKNIRYFSAFFNVNLADSSQVTHFKTTAELEQVKDTIITYGYDDNFNEIEKKTFQTITQPNYVIAFQSKDVEKTWHYFQNKKWINAGNQFTAIPFQPNFVEKNKTGMEIKSTRKPVQLSSKLNENYIFVRNNPLLLSSFKTVTATEKKIVSSIDYIFYGNKGEDYYIILKGKKEELPLILRW